MFSCLLPSLCASLTTLYLVGVLGYDPCPTTLRGKTLLQESPRAGCMSKWVKELARAWMRLQVRTESSLQPKIGGHSLGRGAILLVGAREQVTLVIKGQHLGKGGTAGPSMACLETRDFS